MVFCVLYDLWWSIWDFASSWWGKIFLDPLWRKIMVVSYSDLQIRTLGMLRSRFHTLPYAFNACLCPPLLRSDQKKRKGFFFNRFQVCSLDIHLAKINVLWLFFPPNFTFQLFVSGFWKQTSWSFQVCCCMEPNHQEFSTWRLSKQQVILLNLLIFW